MQALFPIRFSTLPPAQSGYYLTNLGDLYFNKEHHRFQLDKETNVDLNIGVSHWYKWEEVFTPDDVDDAYKRGIFDAEQSQQPVNLNTVINDIYELQAEIARLS